MCTITQYDLGPSFADVEADVADLAIVDATSMVLGPSDSQTATSLRWTACGLDPCLAIKLLARHTLAIDPNSGATATPNHTSESIGGVSVSYAGASSATGTYSSTSFGQAYQDLRTRFDICSSKRTRGPLAVAPRDGCGC
jgi:hypothetical protein